MPSFLLLLLSFLLLPACSPKEQASIDFPPALSPAPALEAPLALEGGEGLLEEGKEGTGRYSEDYYGEKGAERLAGEVVGNGETSLLFFFAAWCPRCQTKEALLKQLYAGGAYDISTYKLNYDESMALKARYGVTTQDTVVLIDGAGMAMQMVVGANETDLRYLLSRR